jgi:GT2 family glycosyltransferase
MADTQNVIVGYLHPDTITQQFHHCLFGLFIHDTWRSQRILNFAPQFSGANLCKARNQMVHDMLEQERAEWLLILDSDATFPPNMLDLLLEDADPEQRPIVGALAHQRRGKKDEHDAPVFDEFGRQQIEVLPTMYKIEWDDDGNWAGYREVSSYVLGLNEVDATGCHCLLVHRDVFEKIQSSHPYRWFREDEVAPDIVAGEDIWFCLEARKLGYPIYVDTRLESGHVKTTELTSSESHVERIT